MLFLPTERIEELMEKEVSKNKLDEAYQESDVNKLVLFNDEVNTFDWVIDSLIEVCGHDSDQAEQCALIAHMRGKCPVKEGDFDDLKLMKDKLLNRKLTAEIQ